MKSSGPIPFIYKYREIQTRWTKQLDLGLIAGVGPQDFLILPLYCVLYSRLPREHKVSPFQRGEGMTETERRRCRILRWNLESEDTNCGEWVGLSSQTECSWSKFCMVHMVLVKNIWRSCQYLRKKFMSKSRLSASLGNQRDRLVILGLPASLAAIRWSHMVAVLLNVAMVSEVPGFGQVQPALLSCVSSTATGGLWVCGSCLRWRH